ncbi:hypothetical protein GGD81_001344 [Rhodobium orientis]|uniref:DNA transposition protein n=1 Tax=Rhodobium orientis TaxID=34017 RepID=A0A327JRW3_9HYPH|nr:hypothetical protein [Rhodobium orientis]MBB4302317.1 hypothetical protein [Rhodobium orientis]MBK5949025.1 hypothetical protein [Rhodobium orientis]RAI29017.1 hypothetical protein CH339_04855 [Rhodobium orientis]
MARRRDTGTLDLFRDVLPAPVVERFDEADVHAWNMAGRLSKAVAATLDAAGMGRVEVAAAMSDILKDKVTESTLDAYASQAKEKHTISALRLAALVMVTGDARALNTLLVEAGLIVVPAKYEALLRRERAKELRERAEREEAAAEAEWKANR